MLKFRSFVLCGAAAVFLAGCVPDPRAYETAPVEVITTRGTVTCQLYQPDLVVWDRAIDRPRDMGVQEADQICYQEGLRLREVIRADDD